MIHCPIPLPAGYEVVDTILRAGTDDLLTTIWLVPGGGPVYCHASATRPRRTLTDETLWTDMLARVQDWVATRGQHRRPQVRNGTAVSDNPPSETPNGEAVTVRNPRSYCEGVRSDTQPGSADAAYDLLPG